MRQVNVKKSLIKRWSCQKQRTSDHEWSPMTVNGQECSQVNITFIFMFYEIILYNMIYTHKTYNNQNVLCVFTRRTLLFIHKKIQRYNHYKKPNKFFKIERFTLRLLVWHKSWLYVALITEYLMTRQDRQSVPHLHMHLLKTLIFLLITYIK